MSQLKRTQLYEVHVAAGADMVDFGGWEMPIQYPDGIVAEHLYTRHACSLFDVSHMGRLLVEGKDRVAFLQHVLSSNVLALDINQAQYCIIPNENGGAVDDAYLYKFEEDRFLLVVNAANTDKDLQHLSSAIQGYDCTLTNITGDYAAIAVQGPKCKEILSVLSGGAAITEPMKNALNTLTFEGRQVRVAKTGYTGEPLGYEVYIASGEAAWLWNRLLELGARPAGLGARDTLRLEAGLPLYGHEMTDDISPLEAGLGWAVKMHKDDFIGKEALLKQKTEGPAQRLRGIKLDGNAVPRHGYKVLKDGQEVGEVTTGYRLISAEGSCCVALVDASVKMDDRVEVQIRKKTFPGTVVKKKFYDKHYKK